jgi:hypothetical protein
MKTVHDLKELDESTRVQFISFALTCLSQFKNTGDVLDCLSKWLAIKDPSKLKKKQSESPKNETDEVQDTNVSVSPLVVVKFLVEDAAKAPSQSQKDADIEPHDSSNNGYSLLLSRLIVNEVKFLGRAVFKGWQSGSQSAKKGATASKDSSDTRELLLQAEKAIKDTWKNGGSLHHIRHHIAGNLLPPRKFDFLLNFSSFFIVLWQSFTDSRRHCQSKKSYPYSYFGEHAPAD